MSCIGCSSPEEPICTRCRSVLREQEQAKMSDKFEELTPRELGYMLAVAGLLASNDRSRMHPHEFVDLAIEMVDILFEKIEAQRKINEQP